MKLTALPLCLVVLTPATLFAQSTDDEEGAASEGKGEEVDTGLNADTSAGSNDFSDLDGTEENPNAPRIGEEPEAKVGGTATAAKGPVEYPIALVDRPITLPERMTEVQLALPNRFDPYVQNLVLAGHHGVTDKIQAGIRYGGFSFVAADGNSEFLVGKTFAVDGFYQVFPWLAGQLSVPILVDPFAAGVTLGAPIQFTFFDKLRLTAGRDLVTFRLSRFAPSAEDPSETEVLVVLDETGADAAIPDGELNVNVGAAYQHRENLAIDARFGIRYIDFKSGSNDPTLFDVGVRYSTSNKVDVGGRIGFSDLNDAGGTFGLYLVAAYRI
jgi:hypothetical protein